MRARHEAGPSYLDTWSHLQREYGEEELRVDACRHGYEAPIATGAIPTDGGVGYSRCLTASTPCSPAFLFPFPWRNGWSAACA